jgi:hypothetical protein
MQVQVDETRIRILSISKIKPILREKLCRNKSLPMENVNY